MAIRSCFSSCLPRKPSAPQGNSKEICANKDNIDLESGTGKGFKIDWKMLGFLPLMFMIFYDVSGGPFGIEDAVGAAGPFYAIVGFAVFPLIWSIPEAMITAELGTMFPENGGYVRWVSAAFGPYWGFQEGWMKWLSGVIDNGVYPGLFLEYLEPSIPALQRSKIKAISALAITVFLTFIDYLGLVLVGWTVVILGISTLLPFAIMGIIAIPKMKPRRLLEGKFKDIDWNLYLNTLFWNLNYWDSISTVSGEVKNPKRNLAKAIFSAVVLVAFTYLISLITTTAAVPYVRENWSDGYFTDVATILGGVWLRYWVQGAAAASNMGNFIAEMSGDSFQLLGMAERGMLPAFFARRSRFGTPWVAILFSCLGVIALQWMTIQEIIAAENFLYCFGMVLEFLAFIRLRVVMPNAPRPYKVPLGTVGGTLMCIPPTIMIGAVLRFSELKVFLVSLVAILIGLVLYPVLMYIKKKNWLEFIDESEFDDEEEQEKLDEHSTKAEVTNS